MDVVLHQEMNPIVHSTNILQTHKEEMCGLPEFAALVDFEPSTSACVCSYHFRDEDYTKPASITPAQFRKRALIKTAIPSLNLRGADVDERLPMRTSMTSSKARATPTTVDQSFMGNSETYESEVPSFPLNMASCPEAGHNDEPQSFHLKELVEELTVLRKEIDVLRKKQFMFANLSDALIKSYTGLDRPIFENVVSMIDRFCPLQYWSGKAVTSISKQDHLLLFIVRLRLNLPYFDLARRFCVSHTTVQNIFLTYLHAFHEIFYIGIMDEIPSLEKNRCSLPSSFGDMANCRIILDCTEFRIETPRKDLEAATSSYSNYKHNKTAKFLIGVAPNGSITFVCQAFPGSTSDRMVTDQSGVISHLKAQSWN